MKDEEGQEEGQGRRIVTQACSLGVHSERTQHGSENMAKRAASFMAGVWENGFAFKTASRKASMNKPPVSFLQLVLVSPRFCRCSEL